VSTYFPDGQPDIHTKHMYQLSLNSAFRSVSICHKMEDSNPLIENIIQDSPSSFSKLSERTVVFTKIWRNQILLGFALFVLGVVLFVVLTIIFETGIFKAVMYDCHVFHLKVFHVLHHGLCSVGNVILC
jgi:hypothetical protein